MAKAAWCAACNANVYVTDDGTCPQGHGPENLSNFYDAPELSPADHAVLDASAPAGKPKSSRTLIIVLVVIGVLILCGVGACVAGVAGLAAFSESSSQESAAPIETTTPADGSSEADSLMPGVDLDAEIYPAVDHFYPGFEPTGYYLLGDPAVEPVEFQIVAASTEVPGFQIAFTAYRYSDTPITQADDLAWYFGADSGALWERAADSEEGGATLWEFVGADPLLSAEEGVQVMSDFVAAHPGMVVTRFSIGSDTEFTLSGIAETELEDWDGASTSFDSVWTGDPNAGTWTETSFTETGQ